jgi:phage minor structural protein
VVEIFSLDMQRIGAIPDTWENQLTLSLNAAGEFSFNAAIESINIETLEMEPSAAIDYVQHNTFIRWKENGNYLFTGLPAQIEREESESGEVIAKVQCYGALHFLQRYNVRVRKYTDVEAAKIVRDLLSVQNVIVPGDIDFVDPISISFSYETLHDALLAMQNAFGGDIYVDPDTLTLNWVRQLGGEGPEIRYRRNMTFIRFLSDSSEHFTRIIPLGANQGDEDNRVTIASVNNGLDYLEADTVKDYGVIEYLWEDERYKDPATLKKAAERMLEEHKHPSIMYETSMIDLSRWVDEWGEHPYRDREPQLGDTVRVYHPRLGIDIQERIVKIERNLDEDKRHEVGIELGEKKRTWADIIQNIDERTKSSSRSVRGYNFTANHSVRQDINASTKARIKFFMDSEIKSVNYARLLYTGSEVGQEDSSPPPTLSVPITVTVNGQQVSSSNTVQQEIDITSRIIMGKWNTVDFTATGPIHVDASLAVKSFYES